jgi:hypothetical protein
MSLKYLFGPVSATFAEQNLKRQRDGGACLAFNADGDTDLTVRPATPGRTCAMPPRRLGAGLPRPPPPVHDSKAQQFGFEQLWGEFINRLESEWPSLRAQAGYAGPADDLETLHTRCRQAHAGGRSDDSTLLRDLERALKESPTSAVLHNSLGCLLAGQAPPGNAPSPAAEMAARSLRRALASQPDFVIAGLNLAEALEARQRPAATEAARRALARLHRGGLDRFRDGISPALAWCSASRGRAAGTMRDVLRPKRNPRPAALALGMLARWTATRPSLRCRASSDLPLAVLWAGPGSHERHAEAGLPPRGPDANSLDRDAARLAFQALRATAGTTGPRDERVPRPGRQAVPHEPWFAEPRPKGNELAGLPRPAYELILCDRAQ